jgi:hypothetical protein
MDYKFPTADQIRADVTDETTAINVTIAAMEDLLEACPVPDHVKLYAVCELAFKLSDQAFVEEVFNEIRVLKNFKGQFDGPD